MNIITIRTTVNEADAPDVEAAVGGFFAALQREQPEGIRYTSARLPDGLTYLTVLELDDGVENPLPKLPEFGQFQNDIKQWAAEPPVAEQYTVVAAYRG